MNADQDLDGFDTIASGGLVQQRAAVLVELGHGGIHQPNVGVQEHQLLSGSADELSSMGVKAGEKKEGVETRAGGGSKRRYNNEVSDAIGGWLQGETHIDTQSEWGWVRRPKRTPRDEAREPPWDGGGNRGRAARASGANQRAQGSSWASVYLRYQHWCTTLVRLSRRLRFLDLVGFGCLELLPTLVHVS